MGSSYASFAIVAGLLALGIGLVWPSGGVVGRWLRFQDLRRRALVEDALKHFHHCEFGGLVATLDSLSGALAVSRNCAADLVASLETRGLVQNVGGRSELTGEGRRYALRVIRLHRLWERYLAEQTGVAESGWHDLADRHEHLLAPERAEDLAAEMGDPRYDPHGAPIPTAAGEVGPPRGKPLATLQVGELAVVTHIEDEPKTVYAQLVAQGVGVGTRLRVLEASAQRVLLEADGEEHVLAPVVASNVSVVKLPAESPAPPASERLSAVAMNEEAEVVGIAQACRGQQRRRLLDLGLVPGTVVRPELQSAGRDPTAYRIRGALIALRKGQADLIQVRRQTNGKGSKSRKDAPCSGEVS